MRQLEVFFDYAFPYCLRAHRYLRELLPTHPDIEVVWRPCEAHPRPDRYGPHSDLCMQGMLYAQECGADLWAYHEVMYEAALRRGDDIEDAGVVAALAAGLVDETGLRRVLASGELAEGEQRGNEYAWREAGVWVVPSYRMDGKRLDSVEDVGVTREQLAAFLL